MNLETKKYLRENPCYLVAAILLAADGKPEILTKFCKGNEKEAFDYLQRARVYAHNVKIYGTEGFPISINEKTKECIKIHERLAGLLIAGKKTFTSLPCGLQPKHSYGKNWIEQFTPAEREIILERYELEIQDSSLLIQPSKEKTKGISKLSTAPSQDSGIS